MGPQTWDLQYLWNTIETPSIRRVFISKGWTGLFARFSTQNCFFLDRFSDKSDKSKEERNCAPRVPSGWQDSGNVDKLKVHRVSTWNIVWSQTIVISGKKIVRNCFCSMLKLPSGNLTWLRNITIFHGKPHYFDWVIFKSYSDRTRGYCRGYELWITISTLECPKSQIWVSPKTVFEISQVFDIPVF